MKAAPQVEAKAPRNLLFYEENFMPGIAVSAPFIKNRDRLR